MSFRSAAVSGGQPERNLLVGPYTFCCGHVRGLRFVHLCMLAGILSPHTLARKQ